MKKAEFKAALFDLLDADVDGLTYEQQMQLAEKHLTEYQIKHDNRREKPNRGESWTDEELRVVLSSAPTKENCVRYAKIFKRGYGSIEQIYRWASAYDQTIREKRPDDVFVARIKAIAKELGWRA